MVGTVGSCSHYLNKASRLHTRAVLEDLQKLAFKYGTRRLTEDHLIQNLRNLEGSSYTISSFGVSSAEDRHITEDLAKVLLHLS